MLRYKKVSKWTNTHNNTTPSTLYTFCNSKNETKKNRKFFNNYIQNNADKTEFNCYVASHKELKWWIDERSSLVTIFAHQVSAYSILLHLQLKKSKNQGFCPLVHNTVVFYRYKKCVTMVQTTIILIEN